MVFWCLVREHHFVILQPTPHPLHPLLAYVSPRQTLTKPRELETHHAHQAPPNPFAPINSQGGARPLANRQNRAFAFPVFAWNHFIVSVRFLFISLCWQGCQDAGVPEETVERQPMGMNDRG